MVSIKNEKGGDGGLYEQNKIKTITFHTFFMTLYIDIFYEIFVTLSMT